MSKKNNLQQNTVCSLDKFTQTLNILHKHCLWYLWHLESLSFSCVSCLPARGQYTQLGGRGPGGGASRRPGGRDRGPPGWRRPPSAPSAPGCRPPATAVEWRGLESSPPPPGWHTGPAGRAGQLPGCGGEGTTSSPGPRHGRQSGTERSVRLPGAGSSSCCQWCPGPPRGTRGARPGGAGVAGREGAVTSPQASRTPASPPARPSMVRRQCSSRLFCITWTGERSEAVEVESPQRGQTSLPRWWWPTQRSPPTVGTG